MQLFFIWILSVFSFWVNDADRKAFRLTGYAQGTTYQVTYYAADSVINKSQIDSILIQIDSSLSIYKPYSLISRFNDSEKGLQIDLHFKTVVKKALRINKETGGAFDFTVKPMVDAWGFGVKPVSVYPDSATVENLLNCIGSDKIQLKKDFLLKEKPCMQVDVNGIAQGYSVDIIANFLESKGVQNYLVELGGEIRVKGRKPQGECMTIGIESPPDVPGRSPVQKLIQLSEGAITTSANYRKYRQSGNKRISHLIDPETGYPVQNELISVTVVAKDAITADGYDNALMGMGLKKAMSFVKSHKKIEAHFIYRKDNGLVADTATAGFYKFIK